MATFGTIEPFDMKPSNWLAYEDRIELFLEANSVDDDKKSSTFLSLIGSECYNLVKTLCSPEKPSEKTVTELFVIIREHFCPKKIIIAERYRFHTAKQTKSESISAYVSKLKKLSENCQFGDFLLEMLRDRFVCGLKDQTMLKRLLTEEDLTFQNAVSIATTMEAVIKDSKELSQPNRQQSAGGKSKGDGAPKKGQSKGDGPPKKGQTPKGSGEPKQNPTPKSSGQHQKNQFAKGDGQPYQRQFSREDDLSQQSKLTMGDHAVQLLGGIVNHFLSPQGAPHQGSDLPQHHQSSPQKPCHHCGGRSHAADACYHKNAKCTECGRQGHTEKVCRAKGKGGKPKGNPGQPKGNPSQPKGGQGKKGSAPSAKLPYSVEESGGFVVL